MMTCCLGTTKSASSAVIDEQIKVDRMQANYNIKLLLLGPTSISSPSPSPASLVSFPLLYLVSLQSINSPIRCSAILCSSQGTGDSGKSTFAKQMKILYKGGFSEKELATYKYESFNSKTIWCPERFFCSAPLFPCTLWFELVARLKLEQGIDWGYSSCPSIISYVRPRLRMCSRSAFLPHKFFLTWKRCGIRRS